MKVKNLSVLAGAATLIAGSAAQAVPTFTAVVNTTSPFLVANGLMSATISVTGFDNATAVQGFIGTAANPWNVVTGNGTNFFNVNDILSGTSVIFEGDSAYAAPSTAAVLALNPNAGFDSGLMGSLTAQPNSSNFGNPSDSDGADDAGGFAFFGNGTSDTAVDPAAWISIAPAGIGVSAASNLRVLRITWSIQTTATVNMVLAMNTPAIDAPLSITLGIPAPGALALLGLAGLVGSRRRRA